MDQGLLKWVTNADGERVEAWAYGGDFGEPVHDAQFCINGLVFPNREPHPACHECKAVMVRARAAQHAQSHSGSGRAEHEAEPALGMRGLAEGEPTWRRGCLDPSNLSSCRRTLALRASCHTEAGLQWDPSGARHCARWQAPVAFELVESAASSPLRVRVRNKNTFGRTGDQLRLRWRLVLDGDPLVLARAKVGADGYSPIGDVDVPAQARAGGAFPAGRRGQGADAGP